MNEPQIAGGDILVYARVRDPEARTRFRQVLDDLPGERIDSWLYEVYVEDWDDGLWVEEVERMEGIIDLASDTLIFWRILEGKLVRTCIAGRFA